MADDGKRSVHINHAPIKKIKKYGKKKYRKPLRSCSNGSVTTCRLRGHWKEIELRFSEGSEGSGSMAFKNL